MTFPVRKRLDHKPHTMARFGAVYFITICCQERHDNQLCRDGVANVLLDAARYYHDAGRWSLNLFLLMPDHLHALVGLPGEVELATLIGDYKRYIASRTGVKWQRNFFDHRLRKDESIREKGDYILMNPVRAGLAEKPEQWGYVIFGDVFGTRKNETPQDVNSDR